MGNLLRKGPVKKVYGSPVEVGLDGGLESRGQQKHDHGESLNGGYVYPVLGLFGSL